MKIIIAKEAGFCFGVKRAMDMIYKIPDKYPGKKIYSFREVIHNPQEVRRLESLGVYVVQDIDKIKEEAIAIVGTHGITPVEQENLKNKRVYLIDTTCPYVKKIHNIVEYLAQNNYYILVVGDKSHLEVKGILGHCHGKGKVISSFSEVRNIKGCLKTGIVAQTTQNTNEYKKIIFNIINKLFNTKHAEIRVFNTICDATYKRQEETMWIARKSDVMIIIGGRNSANTRRLYKLSKKIQKNTYLIETADEIKKKWFKNKKILGISAGASTPEWIIKDIVSKIKEIKI